MSEKKEKRTPLLTPLLKKWLNPARRWNPNKVDAKYSWKESK
jgi:hypothetical protein